MAGLLAVHNPLYPGHHLAKASKASELLSSDRRTNLNRNDQDLVTGRVHGLIQVENAVEQICLKVQL